MRPKALTLAIVCAIAMTGLFGPGRQPSSGQTTGREAPCGCYTCYWELVPTLYVNFPDPPKNCYGIVSASQCGVVMSKMPDKGKAFCQKIKKELKITSFKDCPEYAAACPDDEEKPPEEKEPPKCKEREGPPWFDPSAQGCQNLQETRTDARWTPEKGGTCIITLRACGYIAATRRVNDVWIKDGKLEEAISAGFTPQQLAAMGMRPIRSSECKAEFFANEFGVPPQRVCCDIWQEAVRAGSGCNPETDADCDGLPNDVDKRIDKNVPYYAPPSANETWDSNKQVDPKDFNSADFDPRPPGLGWDEVMPNEPCKKCKWVALSGKLTCSPDGQTEHEYKATWKCPTSGVERTVTKRVPARFPCTPPNRPKPAG